MSFSQVKLYTYRLDTFKYIVDLPGEEMKHYTSTKIGRNSGRPEAFLQYEDLLPTGSVGGIQLKQWWVKATEKKV